MHKLAYPLAVALVAALHAAPLWAIDRVKLQAGTQSTGKLVEISPTEVSVELGATKRTFAVNEIDVVMFDAEPNDLTQARLAVRGGRFENAQTLLNKINVAEIDRPELLADIEFYKAITATRLALAGTGSKPDAGKKLLAFEKANASSYHYYETCEALGDLLASLGKFDQAEAFYKKLAAAPWPDYKSRAALLSGRALVSAKDYPQAIARFEEVLASAATGKIAEQQKLAAALGKASALAGSGQSDEAVKSIQEIIAKADPENQELHARAYTLLGNCHQAAGKNKEALLDFLHVDLLYSRFPDQHAEALAHLATLWAAANKTDRATQALATLKEKYPTSTWAQKQE